jgi:hypothetical protein
MIKADTIDISSMASIDSFALAILRPGTATPTGWTIVLAGPAHPQSVALAAEMGRETIEKEKAIEFAQVNNRKWKVDDESVETRRLRNVTRVCQRIISWSPDPTFKALSPDPLPFTLDNAVKLFLRPDMGAFFVQVTDYLTSERSFTQPSGQT